jgi:hypothetical protein
MSYELAGVVKVVQDVETFKGGSFTKRGVVVTVEDGKFPQDILLEFVQDKVSLLEGVAPGDDVQITFDIRGREYNGRYFNNLQGWRLDKVGASNAAGGADAGAATNTRPPLPTEAPDNIEEINDDIDPF